MVKLERPKPVRLEKYFSFKHGDWAYILTLSDGAEIEYTAQALWNLRQHQPDEYRRLFEMWRAMGGYQVSTRPWQDNKEINA